MQRLTPSQFDDLAQDTQGRPAADPSHLLALADAARKATVDHRGTLAGRLAHGSLATMRRLLDVEAELAATRDAIARHVAAADAGDDPAPCDLLDDLARAGHGIDETALDIARALHDAEAVTRW